MTKRATAAPSPPPPAPLAPRRNPKRARKAAAPSPSRTPAAPGAGTDADAAGSPLVTDVARFVYTDHKEWPRFCADAGGACLRAFEAWYGETEHRYRHVKHAFNSLCKSPHGLILKTLTVAGARLWCVAFYTASDKFDGWWYREEAGPTELRRVLTVDEDGLGQDVAARLGELVRTTW